MEINRSNIKEFVEKCNAKPDKDYGQNFLVEPLICEKIVDLLSQTKNPVLEIGPGLGSLTHFLYKKFSDLTIVDIDERMIAFLNLFYKENGVSLIKNDIRNVDLTKYDSIIGNLPYNITKEILVYCFSTALKCNEFVFMIQKEAASHIFSTSGKDYGPLSIFAHLIGDLKKELQVKAGCFYPVPKCDSVVFSLKVKILETERSTALETYNFAKKCFLNRRKTLYNNLLSAKFDKDKILASFNKLNLKLTTRPEEVSYSLYTNLMQLLK